MTDWMSYSEHRFLAPSSKLPDLVTPLKGHSSRLPYDVTQIRQWLKEGCRKPVLGVWLGVLVRLRDVANIVVSRGHSRWCPAYVESGITEHHRSDGISAVSSSDES